MSRNLLIIFVVLACLACRAMSEDGGETPGDTSGVFEKAGDAYWTAVGKVQNATEAMMRTYEDHLKPMVKSSITWASEKTASVWDKIKIKVSDYWSDSEPQ